MKELYVVEESDGYENRIVALCDHIAPAECISALATAYCHTITKRLGHDEPVYTYSVTAYPCNRKP